MGCGNSTLAPVQDMSGVPSKPMAPPSDGNPDVDAVAPIRREASPSDHVQGPGDTNHISSSLTGNAKHLDTSVDPDISPKSEDQTQNETNAQRTQTAAVSPSQVTIDKVTPREAPNQPRNQTPISQTPMTESRVANSNESPKKPTKEDTFMKLYNESMTANKALADALEARRQRQAQQQPIVQTCLASNVPVAGLKTATASALQQAKPKEEANTGSSAVSTPIKPASTLSASSSASTPAATQSPAEILRARAQEAEARRRAELEALRAEISRVDQQISSVKAAKSQQARRAVEDTTHASDSRPGTSTSTTSTPSLEQQVIIASAPIRPARRASITHRGSLNNGTRRPSQTGSNTGPPPLTPAPSIRRPSITSTGTTKPQRNSLTRSKFEPSQTVSVTSTGASTSGRGNGLLQRSGSRYLDLQSPPSFAAGASTTAADDDDDTSLLEETLVEEVRKETVLDLELKRAELRIRALERAAAAKAKTKQKRKVPSQATTHGQRSQDPNSLVTAEE